MACSLSHLSHTHSVNWYKVSRRILTVYILEILNIFVIVDTTIPTPYPLRVVYVHGLAYFTSLVTQNVTFSLKNLHNSRKFLTPLHAQCSRTSGHSLLKLLAYKLLKNLVGLIGQKGLSFPGIL